MSVLRGAAARALFQRSLARGVPERTAAELDVEAVGLVSAVLRTLARRGRAAATSTLLVVGPERNPSVAAAAQAAGLAAVRTCSTTDRTWSRLRALQRESDVVLDLLGVVPEEQAGDIWSATPAPVVRPTRPARPTTLPEETP